MLFSTEIAPHSSAIPGLVEERIAFLFMGCEMLSYYG
jgi:hypothetical protein